MSNFRFRHLDTKVRLKPVKGGQSPSPDRDSVSPKRSPIQQRKMSGSPK